MLLVKKFKKITRLHVRILHRRASSARRCDCPACPCRSCRSCPSPSTQASNTDRNTVHINTQIYTIRLKTVKTTAVLAFNRLAEQSASAFYKQDCLKQIKIIKKQVALYNAKLLNFTEDKIVIKMRIFLEMEEFVFCNAVKKIVNAIYCFLSSSRYKK